MKGTVRVIASVQAYRKRWQSPIYNGILKPLMDQKVFIYVSFSVVSYKQEIRIVHVPAIKIISLKKKNIDK